MTSFGAAIKIKQLREYNNFSQAYMAEKLEISQPLYAKLESGKSKIDINRISKIAAIFDIGVNELLSDESFVLTIQNNTLNDNSSVIKEFNPQLAELYERIIEEKEKHIERLETRINQLESKS